MFRPVSSRVDLKEKIKVLIEDDPSAKLELELEIKFKSYGSRGRKNISKENFERSLFYFKSRQKEEYNYIFDQIQNLNKGSVRRTKLKGEKEWFYIRKIREKQS